MTLDELIDALQITGSDLGREVGQETDVWLPDGGHLPIREVISDSEGVHLLVDEN